MSAEVDSDRPASMETDENTNLDALTETVTKVTK